MRLIKHTWTFRLLLVSIFALLMRSESSAQITSAQPPNPNITAPGPQRHNAPAGQQPTSNPPSIAKAPPPISTITAPQPGDVEGFVYWDTSIITHKPAASCSGLAVSISAAGSSIIRIQTGIHFKYAGQVKAFLSGGKIAVYDVCIYAYDHQAVGPQLQAQLVTTDRNAFSSPVTAQTPTVAPITIINGQCNMLPPIVPSSVSDLTAHWGSCQNRAYDVNFALTPALQVMSAGGGGSGTVHGQKNPGSPGGPLLRNTGPAGSPMLSGAPSQGMLGSGAAPSAQAQAGSVGSSRVDLQACKLEYSIVSPK